MANQSVFCIANSWEAATRVATELKESNFSGSAVSVLFRDTDTTREFAHAKPTKAPAGAGAGAGISGVVEAAVGWLAGLGSLLMPGTCALIAAGPVMTTLSRATHGTAADGIAGGLISLGVPEIVAKRYEGKVRNGNILIAVHTDDSREIAWAKSIFTQAGAQDICTTGEATVSQRKAA